MSRKRLKISNRKNDYVYIQFSKSDKHLSEIFIPILLVFVGNS
jgi:hypothetical protein